MANSIGIGSGFSLAEESIYGTGVTPTRAMPFVSESLTLDIRRIDSRTLRGGNYLPTSSSWRPGVRVGGGDVQTLLYDHAMGPLLKAMLGGAQTIGAGPFTHTYSVAAALPSNTLEVTIGGSGGGSLRKRCLGAKVADWEIAFAADENATLGLTWVYQNEVVETGALEGSYPADLQAFNFVDGVVTGGAQPDGCINSLKFTGSNNLKGDQFCMGTTLIDEPVRNGFMEITGEMEATVPGTTADYVMYSNGVELSLILTLTAPSGNTLTFTTNVRVDGTTPTVGGPEMLTHTIPFTVIAATTDALAFQVVAVNDNATD